MEPRFSSAILKLTAVCNLDCSYCYMFNQADQTFRRVPPLMDSAIAHRFLTELRRYLQTRPGRFTIVLHGGEPTLWPLDRFEAFLDGVDRLRAEGHDLAVTIQTNGLRLAADLLDLFAVHRVSVGISLDGPQMYNDQLRVTRGGRGSYERVARTVAGVLDRHPEVVGGFLSVANPEIPPDEYLAWVRSLPIPRVDVLWPIHYHWGNPPWVEIGLEEYRRRPRYGDWLSELFGLWMQLDDPTVVVRGFRDLILQSLGGKGHTDSIVNDELAMFVVNTDGGIEYPDYFRAHRNGGSRTRFNVLTDSFAAVAEDPGFSFCIHLRRYLPDECRPCPHVGVCGGGFLPGRFSGEGLPLRRSVLCYDHFRFYGNVRTILARYGVDAWPQKIPELQPSFVPA